MTTEVTWKKPSPGTWEYDASHQQRPYGRYMDEAILEDTRLGFEEGFADAGIPLKHIDGAIINGWYYLCVRPLGGPPEGGAPPPAFVMRLLFLLHPEMRRRHRRAKRWFAEERWRERVAHWTDELQPIYQRRIDAAAAVNITELDDTALARHLETVTQVLRDITREHFRGIPACSVPIGDLLVHSERWAGITAAELMPAVAGFMAATTAPVQGIDAIVRSLRAADSTHILEEQDAVSVLAAIDNLGGDAASALAQYRQRFGIRIATNYSVFGSTLNEMPELMVQNLRQRRNHQAGSEVTRGRSDDLARRLRDRIPSQHRDDWDRLLEAARHCGERREAEGGLLLAATGLARYGLIEAGARLVAAGRLADAESTFDLTCAETVDLLHGRGMSSAAVAQHTAQRRVFETLTPPPVIGPAGSPPPVELFPPAVSRIVAAMFAFVKRFNPDGDPMQGSGLYGHGVSPGIVEARACVVRTSDDFKNFVAGDILVAHATTPTYNVLLAAASGIVTETGGLISHSAIVSREFGIPGVVGVAGLLDGVPNGALLRVDGGSGSVVVVDPNPQHADAPAEHVDIRPRPARRAPRGPGRIARLRVADDASAFGGKAASLAGLIKGGLPVPDGFALDADFAASLAAGDSGAGEKFSEALAGLRFPVAVRSSANVEDSTGASFAGQFTTVLGAGDGTEAVAAVAEVCRSAEAASVRAYARRMGINEEVAMGVVIQELVSADVAGVLFFDSNAGRHILEASWGLGETVVDGSVTPDQYVIDSDGSILESTPGLKSTEVCAESSGVVRREVSPDRARRTCLSEGDVAALAKLGRRVCEHLGGPVDIEWAIAAGEVHCLQARPITRSVVESA